MFYRYEFCVLLPKAKLNLSSKVQAEEGISDDNVCDILAMIIGAGAETTCSVLQTFFKVMALHPEAMQKAQRGRKFVSNLLFFSTDEKQS